MICKEKTEKIPTQVGFEPTTQASRCLDTPIRRCRSNQLSYQADSSKDHQIGYYLNFANHLSQMKAPTKHHSAPSLTHKNSLPIYA